MKGSFKRNIGLTDFDGVSCEVEVTNEFNVPGIKLNFYQTRDTEVITSLRFHNINPSSLIKLANILCDAGEYIKLLNVE